MTVRVCLIRQSAYPDELNIRREVETLLREGFDAHVISMDAKERPAGYHREETINGVHVHRLPLRRKKASTARYLYDYLAFAAVAAIKVTQLHLRHRFDVVQVNTMPDFLVFSALVPKLLGAKVVVMMQEPVPELWFTLRGKPAPSILAAAEQAALKFADAALTVTQQLKDTYVRRGARADKISVILNVPDTSFLEVGAESAELGAHRDGFTLICHGAIEDRYGQDTILDAVAIARARVPGLRVRILGRGSYLDQFLAKRESLKLEDCVHYLGYVPLPTMVGEILAADAGIVAQKSSPYSNLVHTNKMYEYIHLGKPVLASRLSATEAYFGQDALRYFEAGDPHSLAEAIVDLYEHPEKRDVLRDNAWRLYEDYKWDKQKEQYLAVYRRLLTRN